MKKTTIDCYWNEAFMPRKQVKVQLLFLQSWSFDPPNEALLIINYGPFQ